MKLTKSQRKERLSYLIDRINTNLGLLQEHFTNPCQEYELHSQIDHYLEELKELSKHYYIATDEITGLMYPTEED